MPSLAEFKKCFNMSQFIIIYVYINYNCGFVIDHVTNCVILVHYSGMLLSSCGLHAEPQTDPPNQSYYEQIIMVIV